LAASIDYINTASRRTLNGTLKKRVEYGPVEYMYSLYCMYSTVQYWYL